MKKTILPLILLLSFTINAQSGRTRPVEPKPAKPQPTKPADQPADPNEGINQSRISPDGETVEGDVIRVDTSLVMVPVTVMDRSGRYVPELLRENFRVSENGVEQKIAYFATSDAPFSVVLLLDTSGSTQFRLDDIQEAAINFVSKLKSNDSVTVMSFDDKIRVECKNTTDRAEITRAIRKTRTGGGTRLYDAVEETMIKHLKTIPGRKAVVLFTDGVDTTSRDASYRGTIRLAEESDAPIYTVDYDTAGMGGIKGHGAPLPGQRGTIMGIPIPQPPGIPGTIPSTATPAEYRRAVAYLKSLSNVSGGRFYDGDSIFGINQAFSWIAEELGRLYSLGYYPATTGKDGERRLIKVRTTKPELVVRSRDSYIYSEKKASKFAQVTQSQ